MPANITWREVDSSTIALVGWDRHSNMYVVFRTKAVYCYPGVTRQRAVALATAASPGRYMNHVIKGQYEAIKL